MVDDEFDRTVALKEGTDPRAGLCVIVVANGKAITYPLPTSGEVTIGRFTGSRLPIHHVSLSRMHATLRITADDMTLEDLGSENGTFVREQRIKPGKPVSFTIGDVIRLGDVILIFRL